MKKMITILAVAIVLLAVFILLGPFYILNEGEQAVVTRFGAIVSSNQEAGLKFKIPVVDSAIKYPKKILSWDGDAQRIPTKENQFIWVDATARWKITDPLKYYESVTTLRQGFDRLDDVINSATRTIIAENELTESVRNSNIINEIDRSTSDLTKQSEQEVDFNELNENTFSKTKYDSISKGREVLSDEMLATAREITPQYGIELLDIIIRQIRYSDDLTDSVYQRMIKERNQIAEFFRSYGEGKKAEWIGRLENEKRSVLSSAYARSEKIKGEADAEATKLYSEAYRQDPEFFTFWRSIESYRKTLPQFSKTLTTDMDYFKYLHNQRGR